jgi:HSP20 family molecular chaperone IbpA
VFELDPTVDTAKIRARAEQGVVTVELPKAERVKPRKIKIAD